MQLCNIQYNATLFNPIPIWAALRQDAQSLGINPNQMSTSLAPTAIAIDTRARILRDVVQDARTRIPALLSSIPDDQLQNCMAKLSDEIVYGVLRSVDGFFFESLCLYDLLEKLYISLLRQAKVETGQQPRDSFQLLVQQTETKVGFEWKAYLGKNRCLFIHETAPYLAVQFDPQNLANKELVIESKPNVYLTISDFDNVLKGLSLLSDLCIQDLLRKIQKHFSRKDSA